MNYFTKYLFFLVLLFSKNTFAQKYNNVTPEINQSFLNYCENNYLAKWKFQKLLSKEDFKLLLNEPRKLLEILILTGRYYDSEITTHKLVTVSDLVDDLIKILENNHKISSKCPYPKNLEETEENYLNAISYKSLNALKIIGEKLSIDELFDVLNPKSIEYYNKNLKTKDFLEYKYLIGFLIASQHERLLNHSNKDKVFEIFYYYWKNEHVSYPFKYILTDFLFQINSKKAFNTFKDQFKSKPTNGSFERQAILKSIIEYDFQNNSKFIEDWYWTIYDTNFMYRPIEQDLILELLKNKDASTLKLYTKIITDIKFINK